LHQNSIAQNIARETMRELHDFIKVGMSEKTIEEKALELMTEKGSNSWWYHGIGALVLLGKRSIESMSGHDCYSSEENCVAQNDVITIDIAPTVDGFWGDYARTIFMENGIVAPEDAPSDPLFRQGLDAEFYLHDKLKEIATPEMTYEALFLALNAEIIDLGFENLDIHGNLGHSIEMDQKDRVYIERGNKRSFKDVGKPFTLEPHIRLKGGAVGFKRENIYYFDEEGVLQVL
jgi:Xaa-Pro aminopeptidase